MTFEDRERSAMQAKVGGVIKGRRIIKTQRKRLLLLEGREKRKSAKKKRSTSQDEAGDTRDTTSKGSFKQSNLTKK